MFGNQPVSHPQTLVLVDTDTLQPSTDKYITQLFQPTLIVATIWWASSFLRDYTKDKIAQLELEEGPGG